MKKRTAFIGAILSLIPLGQPLIIKTRVAVSSLGLSIFVSENLYARGASYYLNRAYEKIDKGNYSGAIDDFTRVIEINPKDGGAYYDRGVAKQTLNDFYGAISDYTRAIELNSYNYFAYYNRGFVKETKGDNYGAISDYTRAIEINPKLDNAYYNRGIVKNNLKDYYGAISDYTKAIEINPTKHEAYSNRGLSKGLGFKDKKGACDDFKKAASLGNNFRINWLKTSAGKWCRNM